MSDEEQMAVIGRLVSALSDAKRQHSLLAHQIEQMGEQVWNGSARVMRPGNPEALRLGLSILNPLIDQGGLEKLRSMILEYQVLSVRISEMNKTLEQAGIR